MDTSAWSRVKSEIYSLVGRNPKSNRTISIVAGIGAADVVLDIGCGPGAAVRAAGEVAAKAVGVDRSEAMIDIARRRSRPQSNVSFQVGAAESLPFPDDTFDVVWTIHSFHHWEDPDRGVAETLRVLRPGGRFLIVESETNGSHGLDRSEAEALAARLVAVGYADAAFSKRQRELVISAVSPAAG